MAPLEVRLASCPALRPLPPSVQGEMPPLAAVQAAEMAQTARPAGDARPPCTWPTMAPDGASPDAAQPPAGAATWTHAVSGRLLLAEVRQHPRPTGGVPGGGAPWQRYVLAKHRLTPLGSVASSQVGTLSQWHAKRWPMWAARRDALHSQAALPPAARVAACRGASRAACCTHRRRSSPPAGSCAKRPRLPFFFFPSRL